MEIEKTRSMRKRHIAETSLQAGNEAEICVTDERLWGFRVRVDLMELPIIDLEEE